MKSIGRWTRLHVGCGRNPIPGFLNMDIDTRLRGIAVIGDFCKGNPFADGSFSEIYLSHVLEHIPVGEVEPALRELNRVLAPGGIVKIAVPDLDRICALYARNIDWFTPPHTPWLGLIYGGQTNEFDFHKGGFNFRYLRYLLERAGFSAVREYDNIEEYGIRDGSFSNRPFGEISLNVTATKGARSEEDRVFRFTLLERCLTAAEHWLERLLAALVRLKLLAIRRRLKGLVSASEASEAAVEKRPGERRA